MDDYVFFLSKNSWLFVFISGSLFLFLFQKNLCLSVCIRGSLFLFFQKIRFRVLSRVS